MNRNYMGSNSSRQGANPKQQQQQHRESVGRSDYRSDQQIIDQYRKNKAGTANPTQALSEAHYSRDFNKPKSCEAKMAEEIDKFGYFPNQSKSKANNDSNLNNQQESRIYPNLDNRDKLTEQDYSLANYTHIESGDSSHEMIPPYSDTIQPMEFQNQLFSQENKLLVNRPSHTASITSQLPEMNISENTEPTLKSSDQKLTAFLAQSNAHALLNSQRSIVAVSRNALPEYNILLLGESGTGKSTTINAFANYVKYGTFESAASVSNFVELISSKFLLTDPKTGDDFPIRSGSDANECHTSAGVSCTQSPVAYQFQYHDKLVRIIDTPGMGDTRGLLVDKQNFDRILQYLTHYKELHAICVLIKANESRQVASFRYCITELLSHLHRNACQNIIFCFTFSRNTFYRPGDGFFTLKDFLAEEFPDMKLELRPGENCFFVDNEAYRFLVAKKCHYPFLPEQAKSYKESWDKSSHQTNKMIERILLTLTPHNLEETFELNKARKFILSLAQPMVQLQLNIKDKIQIATTEMVRFNKSHKSIQDLQNSLSALIGNELQMNKLNYPAVVCTSTECTQARQLQDGQNVLRYSARCHSECTEIEIENNSLGHPLLKNCAAIEQDTGKCRSCRCSWKKHMYLTLEYNFVNKHLLGKEKITEIVNERSHAQRIQLLTGAIEKLRSDLICELDSLQIFNAIYGHLLEKFSNTSYSRFTEPYLDVLMEEERKKSAAIANYKIYAQEACKILDELKHSQAARIDQVRQSIQEGRLPDFDLKSVNSLCDDLYKLDLSGPKLRHLIQAFNSAEQNQQCEHIERIGLNLTEQ